MPPAPRGLDMLLPGTLGATATRLLALCADASILAAELRDLAAQVDSIIRALPYYQAQQPCQPGGPPAGGAPPGAPPPPIVAPPR